jgi:hypothetical protein
MVQSGMTSNVLSALRGDLDDLSVCRLCRIRCKHARHAVPRYA